MGRFIVTIIWSVLYMLIIGFIAAPLSNSTFEPVEAIVFGIIFGVLFSLIIPTILAHAGRNKKEINKN